MKRYLPILCLLVLFTIDINAQKPYVILISFDAFRWDYLDRNLSPNLEKMRKEGVSALSLRPSFPSVTFPNHLSIITGMYPAHHGIILNNFRDPWHNTVYKMKDTSVTRDGRWYLGEALWETAERQGITCASYFWPGSEQVLTYRRPTYYEKYVHTRPYETRIEGIIDWLKLPIEKRPHFITAYFHETDSQGHDFGPNSPQTNEAIKRLDGIVSLLYKKLDEIKMKDSINVIILSDHGMTEVSSERIINTEKIANDPACRVNGEGPIQFIDAPKEKIGTIYSTLKTGENHFKVYLRDEIPEYFHYSDNPFISPIVIIADLGWTLTTNRPSDWLGKEKGNHGFDNNQTDMHGIFLASGPNFKKGYHTGTLWNVDVYPLLCKILGIYPRVNIDGRLDRIEFLLK